jgi:uncharacterized membrane protein
MMTQAQTWRDAYLEELKLAAASLPPERRAELLAQISEHLDTELAGVRDAEAAREVLQRLGEPGDVVAEAEVDLQPADPNRSTAAELIALLLMGLGSFALPLIAPGVGVLIMRSSPRWTPHEIRVSAGIIGVGAIALVALVVLAASGATSGAAITGALALLAVMVLVGPVAAVYAGTRPRRG